ncbi:MAG: ribonuclease III domain-containing protein [Halobacteriota archaeon]
MELTELEDLVRHQFKKIALLEEAITTGSYATEHPGSSDYQKLEFLGDRVISLILAENLLVSKSLDEGKMTFLKSELENNERLADYGEKIGLRNYIRASEKRENIVPKVIADVFEAICGAIYLDSEESIRIKEVKKFLLKFDIFERIKEEMSSGGEFLPIRNQFENKFREINRCNPEIDFEYSSTGEGHQTRWRIEKCSIKDAQTGECVELKGVKSDTWFDSKKDAETDAITQAYGYMEKKGWELKL